MIGNICREKGKLPEAELCYKTALLLFPDYPDAFGNMALVFSAQGKKDSALILLDRAAALNPGDRKIGENKGKLLLENGRYREAIELAVERLEVTPDDPAFLYINALGVIKTGRDEDAMRAAERFRVHGDTARIRELEKLVSQLKKQF
jgi:Flp pilus assembly protein TadD